MILLGCKPKGRNTEQHDILFVAGRNLSDIKKDILAFWPEGGEKLHIDAWREVTQVDGYNVSVRNRTNGTDREKGQRLFFVNLGGYKREEFEEFHYKLLIVAENKAGAIQKAKQTAFYKHAGFTGAESHIDDKYGIDVDDIDDIEDLLSDEWKAAFELHLEKNEQKDDEIHLGYFKLSRIK